MAFWRAYSAQCYVNQHYSDLANVKLPFEIQYFQLGKFASCTYVSIQMMTLCAKCVGNKSLLPLFDYSPQQLAALRPTAYF